MPQLAFKKIDDEGITLGGNINKIPSGRIVSIMKFDLIPHRLVLLDVVFIFLYKQLYVKLDIHTEIKYFLM